MSRTGKRTNKEIAESIIREGIVRQRITSCGEILSMVVDAFGQTYAIDFTSGRNPKITQLKDERI